MTQKKVMLIILDGWGLAPAWGGNAIEMAQTPYMDRLWKQYPHIELKAAEEAVGLPHKEMGNSEVGHLNIGCGQIVYQNLPGITSAIGDGSFFNNEVLVNACNHVNENNSALHLIGLLSDAGVHAFNGHLYALLEMAKNRGITNVKIHVITDGRDTAPMKALTYLEELRTKIKEIGVGTIASIAGRYWAMDRDNHWDRIRKVYDILVKGEGPSAETPEKVVAENYRQGKSDEFIMPSLIHSKEQPYQPISANDSLIFFNFRPDRARELTLALTATRFMHFPRKIIPNLYMATFFYLEEFNGNEAVKPVFNLRQIEYSLARVLAENNLSQFHIAETEKYAHVTFFFNGGKEKMYPKEYHFLVPSPKVRTFDLRPEMSASIICKKVLAEFKNFNFTVVNFANADMVGHTGNIKATIKAIEAVDKCLGEIVPVALKNDFIVLVTADHGNAEQMIDLNTDEPYTEHTTNPVPFIFISSQNSDIKFRDPGKHGYLLSDITPTILEIMNLEKPSEMTGLSLIANETEEK